MGNPIIIACDFENRNTFEKFLEEFEGETLFLKIGMELYYKEGWSLVQSAKERGHKVFLDLKLHDIPNTVSSALRVLKDLDVDFITIHAQGGKEMMQAAVNAVQGTRTKLLAVTVLTSIDESVLKGELNVNKSLSTHALDLAILAQSAGVDGCICSPHEVALIKETLGESFLCVTPGIRLESGDVHDQKRVMTPQRAMNLGSNHLVIGRAITKNENPRALYESLKETLCQK